ncbi:hypothetical protein [Pelagicoccus sp. SDUM812003]|uniref:hypothetical protein n=1 Tax=Pelagicoccus sp. SDUM812003 TaxID=3041267 RepID=UPI00280F8385|nr:hypothetical protein [Pelagicoccus sp. SDUM812003]MDQ8201614.1 hypothetical protein [Pelagicoccus sp. SDUM812003]
MKRVCIAALAFACACMGKEYQPNEVEISYHRLEVYQLARDYVVETFNLIVQEESEFNPVRFNSHGVWGNFEARIKELGDDRFEVQGWVTALGHDKAQIRWTVHLRYKLVDPEAWRYLKIGQTVENDPEYLGWKFGEYRSLDYQADYAPNFIAMHYGDSKKKR